MKTYFVEARNERLAKTEDCRAIVDGVNYVTAGNGDSVSSDKVWEVLENIASPAEVQLYGLNVVSADTEIDAMKEKGWDIIT